MKRFALVILFGFFPGPNAALSADDAAAADASERTTADDVSAGAQEAADSAGGKGTAAAMEAIAEDLAEKENAKPIDEQLWDAVAAQDRELAIKLVGQGADGGAQVDRGVLQVHIENVQSLAQFITGGLKDGTSFKYSYKANTALKKAAEDGSFEMVRLLLAAGADDADDAALQHAVRKGYFDIVQDFLVARSDDRIDWEGPVVCGESCRDQLRPDSAEFIGNVPALVGAVVLESPQVITALLDAGADVNAKVTGAISEVPGYTALHVAAGRGHDDIVAVLLEGGAAIDRVSDGPRGRTPLMLAASNGHAAVVRTLIGAGADVKLRLPGGALGFGVTALKLAKDKDIKRMLRDARRRRD